jgi:hypothetical protein
MLNPHQKFNHHATSACRAQPREWTPRLVTLGYVVLKIDGIEDLDRIIPSGRQIRRRMEVGECDLIVEATIDDECEEPLERLGVIVEGNSTIGEIDPQELKHEALALEFAMTPSLPGPPLREPDKLREVDGVQFLAATDEI